MKSLRHSELRTVSLCGMSSEIDTGTYKIVGFIGQIKESEIRILYTMYSILIFCDFVVKYYQNRERDLLKSLKIYLHRRLYNFSENQ